MKQQSKKLLMMLPVLPLMMANSPVKQTIDSDYKDFNVSFVSQEKLSDSSAFYRYNYHAENTGDGYIYEIIRTKNNNYVYGIFYQGAPGCIFGNQIIGPHSEQNFYFEDYDYEVNNAEYVARAYTEFADYAVIKGSKEISFLEDGYQSYGYFVDLEVTNLNEIKYYYRFILNLEYEGAKYSVLVYDTYFNDRHGFSFYSSKRLDLSILSPSETPIAVAQEIYPDYREPTLNIPALLIALGVVGGGIAIFSGIYFLVKTKKKKENS